MFQKRKQTLLAGAGLLTALTLSVAALAGCTPSSFKPGVPAAANTPSTAPASTTPATTPAAANFDTIEGKATLKGAPLANAEIRVYNALTDKAAGLVGGRAIIASGGGNIIASGGGNLHVLQAGDAGVIGKTDADGNFTIDIEGLTTSSVVRVVATSGGKSVVALIDGAGVLSPAAGYTVAQTPGRGRAKFQARLDAKSTALSGMSAELLGLVSAFKSPEAKEAALKGLLTDIAKLGAAIGEVQNQDGLTSDVNLQGHFVNATAIKAISGSNEIKDLLGVAINGLSDDLKTAASSNTLDQTVLNNLANDNPTVSITQIDIKNGKLDIGGTTFDVTVGSEPDKAPPTTDPDPNANPDAGTAQSGAEEDGTATGWQYYGDNFTPDVVFADAGATMVTVVQSQDEEQITGMSVELPVAHLQGYNSLTSFESRLTATVTAGTTSTPGGTLPRNGTLTFVEDEEGLQTTGDVQSIYGIIRFNSQEIGYYSLYQTGTTTDGTLRMDLFYDNLNDSIELVGKHTTAVRASGVSLLSTNALSIQFFGDGVAAHVQY